MAQFRSCQSRTGALFWLTRMSASADCNASEMAAAVMREVVKVRCILLAVRDGRRVSAVPGAAFANCGEHVLLTEAAGVMCGQPSVPGLLALFAAAELAGFAVCDSADGDSMLQIAARALQRARSWLMHGGNTPRAVRAEVWSATTASALLTTD